MVDPNSTRVGYTPSDDGEFVADDRIVRPASGSQRPTRDFKRVLSKGSRESKDDEENASAGIKKPPSKSFAEELETGEFGTVSADPGLSKDDEENGSQGGSGPVSLFDLSAKSGKETMKGVPQARVDSPADLFRRASSKVEEAPKAAVESATSVQPKEEKFTTSRYTQEQPDIAYINPYQTQNVELSNINIHPAVAPAVRKDLANLVDQLTVMIKSLYTVQKGEQTDTVMKIDHPLLKGGQVVISSFDTARGQLNISFEGLSQAAQRILGDEINKQALITALHEKGYGVQILTVTTAIEHAPPSINQSAFRGQDEEQRNNQQQQQEQEEGQGG